VTGFGGLKGDAVQLARELAVVLQRHPDPTAGTAALVEVLAFWIVREARANQCTPLALTTMVLGLLADRMLVAAAEPDLSNEFFGIGL
jgi:hypothetical protein